MAKEYVDKPKEPYMLYYPLRTDTTKFEPVVTAQGGNNLWVCGECGTLSATQSFAAECCLQKKCSDCGCNVDHYRFACRSCEDAKTEAKRLADSVEVFEHDGWVYAEGFGNRDGYFSDIDDLLEECALNEEEPPEWVYCCKKESYSGIDIDDVLQNSVEDMYEDAYDHLVNVEDLEKAVAEFNAAQTIHSWYPDFTRRIKVPKENNDG